MENIENQMNQLPIRELIGAPFRAVMESQVALALSTHEFIELVGFNDEGSLKTINFDVPVADKLEEGAMSYKTETIKAPILSMVPIPSLMIDKVAVDFQLQVSTTIENFDKTDFTDEEKNKRLKLFSLQKVEMLGKLTESRENTRKENQGAKYNFRVEAKMQDKPEGLQKMLDLIIARMTP
ncbi:DUF2589 domain-containing protein [Flavivirga aquimarina]|uniref:DUF2589 domain-containing protein n=1 Tax=Flavivirga aquimarina TaxID=2027862 RepID=A0ABT8WBR0_9FLAO|nr:DUF2589 domain-containing protein [Flavivirga aquimarina]MDO5970507.1 DUF2589 domain-containing protein [Flavivirga aquimarina]